MRNFIQTLTELAAMAPEGSLTSGLRAIAMICIGLVMAWLAGRVLGRLLAKGTSPERATLGRRLAQVSIAGLAIASAMTELGFDLTVLLGAAGVFTVALGFAAQTSASNFISGLFLIAEQPFSVGDTIEVGTTTGEVVAIDLLSMGIRTFDNRYVRVPNETVMKAEIVNLTRYAIRREQLPLTVSWKEDLDSLRAVIEQCLARQNRVLVEPSPEVRLVGFGTAGVERLVFFWVDRADRLAVRTQLAFALKESLQAAGFEPSYPHRVLVNGQAKDN